MHLAAGLCQRREAGSLRLLSGRHARKHLPAAVPAHAGRTAVDPGNDARLSRRAAVRDPADAEHLRRAAKVSIF